jgi:hypothetical protein
MASRLTMPTHILSANPSPVPAKRTCHYYLSTSTGPRNWRFLPVFLGRGKVNDIPRHLRAYARYRVDTTDGYETLYRRLTDQQRPRSHRAVR